MKQILISFSGGRTSAYMLYTMLSNKKQNEEYIVVFANTGKEHEGTLKFVKDCGENFKCDIIWLEARHKKPTGKTYSKKGWKVGYNKVSFKTASRNGEPFEEMLSVLGIPCSSAPFCSDQLKRKPIEAYLKDINWKGYYKAIGIRCDEMDRVNPKFKEKKIIYPLVKEFPSTKKMIIEWWRDKEFDLKIPLNLGNCDMCWKKSFKVLVQNSLDFPERFDWWEDMILKHSDKSRNSDKAISFFRGGKTIEEIFKLGALTKTQLDLFAKEYKLDGCSESCEVY